MSTEKELKKNVLVKNLAFIVLRALNKSKYMICGVTIVFGTIGATYSLSLPDIYLSEAKLVPATNQGGANIPGQIGNLAALAGVNLGGKTNDKSIVALEVIKSNDFLKNFVNKNNLIVPLLAAKGWNSSTQQLIIDSEIYDEEKKEWITTDNVKNDETKIINRAVRQLKSLISTSQDKNTGIITITIEHVSPVLAQEWLTNLIQAINDEMRNRDAEEAEHSLIYLNKELANSNIAEIKNTLISVISEQMKTKMFVNIRNEYAFKYIDSATLPERKSKPKRALITIASLMFGFFAICMLVIIRTFKNYDY